MKQHISSSTSCLVLLVLVTSVIFPACCSTIQATLQPTKMAPWSFDNQQNKELKFHDLYMNINEMKDQDLDKRLAAAVRFDPFVFFQLFLSAYVLINHVIEPIIPRVFQARIRSQNLLTETSIHIIEIFLRLQVPADLANQSYIFNDLDIVKAARYDMMEIARTREGQQIAYSLICIFNGSPIGCILPLLIRNIPAYMRYVGIMVLLCIPGFGGNLLVKHFLDNLFDISDEVNSESVEKKDIEISSSKSEFVIKNGQSNGSIGNSRVMIKVISESLSVLLETVILVNSVINLPKGHEGKIDPLIICKHLICTMFVLQYVSVRGKSFGVLLSSIFHGTQTLDNVRNKLNSSVVVLRKFSRENIIQLFSFPKVKKTAKKNSNNIVKKKKKTVGEKKLKKKRIEENPPLDV